MWNHQKPFKEAITLEIESDGLGLLRFDLPGERVNKFTPEVMLRLEELLQESEEKAHAQLLKGLLLISGKADTFIAGADVAAILAVAELELAKEAVMKGQAIFDRLEALPIPTVAAIHGPCVGGGLEMILACNWRVASDSPLTQIAAPEVLLGIIPGFGGSQRLPRLVGIAQGLRLIVSGSPIGAKQAQAIGLVDAIFPQATYLDRSRGFLRQAMTVPLQRSPGKKTWAKLALESTPLGRRLVYTALRSQVKKLTRGHYPAPLQAITAVERGMALPLKEGLQVEAELVAPLIVSPISKNLTSLFFLREWARKPSPHETGSREIQKVGVVGAGEMAVALAGQLAYSEVPVILQGIHFSSLEQAQHQLQRFFAKTVARRKLNANEARQRLSLISYTTQQDSLASCDFIWEAIDEDLAYKQRVLGELEKTCAGIFASATISLSLEEMARPLRRPEGLVGLHAFLPLHRASMIEVVRHGQTSPAALATALSLVRRLKKMPIIVADRPGFLLPRLYLTLIDESLQLASEGTFPQSIDRAIVNFGFAAGPLALLDESGASIALAIARVVNAEGTHLLQQTALERLVEKGWLGLQHRRGIYRYNSRGQRRGFNSLLPRALEWPSLSSLTSRISETWLAERLVFRLLNEAFAILREGVVETAEDLEVAMVFALGFPPFRGGLLRYADEMGLNNVQIRLEALAQHWGARFAPDPWLIENVRQQRPLRLLQPVR